MTDPAPGIAPFRRAQRIAAIQVSEILRIGALATERRKQGRPMIVLGAGEPDFDTPDHIKEAAIRAIRAGQTKYTVLDGTRRTEGGDPRPSSGARTSSITRPMKSASAPAPSR